MFKCEALSSELYVSLNVSKNVINVVYKLLYEWYLTSYSCHIESLL